MKSDATQNPNMQELFAIAESPAGKRLLELMQQDSDATIQSAIRQAQTGNYSNLQTILEKLISSPETASLIQDIRSRQNE